MKCLRKYKWVKLHRACLPGGKGMMGYWAKLASRAAFRKGNGLYCGHKNPVKPGMWTGGIVGLKSILGVKRRQQALKIMCELESMGYLTFDLDLRTKKLSYQITDWVMACAGAECMEGAVYATEDYTVTEVRTDDGYTLLKDDIKIVISQVETTELCDIYASDVLGLVQNDPRYATIINDTGDLKNMPQKHLEHHLLTASATVDGNDVNMLEDDGSINAVVPLKVVNTRGFDLPQTGDHGTWMFSVIGILLMAGAAVVIIMTSRKKRTADQ